MYPYVYPQIDFLSLSFIFQRVGLKIYLSTKKQKLISFGNSVILEVKEFFDPLKKTTKLIWIFFCLFVSSLDYQIWQFYSSIPRSKGRINRSKRIEKWILSKEELIHLNW